MFVKEARCFSEYKPTDFSSLLQLELNNSDAEISFYSEEMHLKFKHSNYNKFCSEH